MEAAGYLDFSWAALARFVRTLRFVKKVAYAAGEERDGIRIAIRAVKAFENEPAAWRWLSRPHPAFGGNTRLSKITTKSGVREVEQALRQIEHGVFSAKKPPSLKKLLRDVTRKNLHLREHFGADMGREWP